MIAWYNGDPWVKGTKAYREMQITHGKHVAISKKLELLSNEQINTASRITIITIKLMVSGAWITSERLRCSMSVQKAQSTSLQTVRRYAVQIKKYHKRGNISCSGHSYDYAYFISGEYRIARHDCWGSKSFLPYVEMLRIFSRCERRVSLNDTCSIIL